MNVNQLKLIIKEKTFCLFNESWYDDISSVIHDSYNKDQRGYVYFIKNHHTGYYKVGVAKDIKNRLGSLNQMNGTNFLLGFTFLEEYRDLEKEIHKHLKRFNIYGEWFRFNKSVADEVIKRYSLVKVMKDYSAKLYIDNSVYLEDEKEYFEKDGKSNPYDKYFSNLIFDFRYDTKEEYLKANFPNMTQKRFTVNLQNYCKRNKLNYIANRTHNSRGFILSENIQSY